MGGALLVERRLQLGGLGGGVAAVLAEGLAQLLQLTRVALTVRLDLPCAVLALGLELAGQAAALLLGRGTILTLGLELARQAPAFAVERATEASALGLQLPRQPLALRIELGRQTRALGLELLDMSATELVELGAHPPALGVELLGVPG